MDHIINNNKKRFLITTADERTWKTDRPVVFLGEWCRLYDRRSVWENLDSELVPYHWDDPSQYYQDYVYLNGLYEELLANLSDVLNQYHDVNHSRRYWRILVGPWLLYFTQIIFDRWTMIQRASHDFEIDGSAMLELASDQFIPNDMNDFVAKFLGDPWNSFIYGQILTNWTNVPCQKVAVSEPQHQNPGHLRKEAPRKSLFRKLRSAIAKKVFCGSFLSRQTDAFFISTYLPMLTDFRLQILLGQMPQLWKSRPVPDTRPNLLERERIILVNPEHDGFEHCVRSLVPKQIPTLYLEGFRELQETITSLPWPNRPNVIFTSNCHYHDDTFKAWAATKVERGSKLIIGQHGGHLGTAMCSAGEDHEIAISDRYLTWGWFNDYPKVFPTAALKLVGKPFNKWSSCGCLLLIGYESSRYSYRMGSGPTPKQLLDYIEDQFYFTDSLANSVKANLLVRLFTVDWGWSQAARWQDRFPDVRLDSGTFPIEPLIRKSRLCVSTCNSTTFLETLGQNIPTIMFWNPDHWELRPSAKPYYERLKEAGIFHESPESAAAKIAEVWDDVPDWWNQREIQETRRYFCDRFARVPERPIRVLREALANVNKQNPTSFFSGSI